MKKKDILTFMAAAVTTAGLALLPNSCANTKAAPSGGLKDTLPPVLVKVVPQQNDTAFPRTKGKVTFYFNEYTVVKTANEIFLSPPQKKKPVTKVSGRNIIVSFPDTLNENQTYTLDLGNGLADNNEGNVFPRFVYTFSTGNVIDSMFITGSVMPRLWKDALQHRGDARQGKDGYGRARRSDDSCDGLHRQRSWRDG